MMNAPHIDPWSSPESLALSKLRMRYTLPSTPHNAYDQCTLIPACSLHGQVLFANAHPSVSHMSAEFVSAFGDSLRMTRCALLDQRPHFVQRKIREVVYSKDAQPFLISGSGTLGWDQVGWRKQPCYYRPLLPKLMSGPAFIIRFLRISWRPVRML